MKLTNLKITPKLGILVGVTLVGLCTAGVLAGYLMQREMLNARIDQTRAIVEMGAQHGRRAEKEVEAGQMTKEAAIAEFGRRGNSMTFDKGAGYLFGTRMMASPSWRPIRSRSAPTAWTSMTNGRKLARELRDGVARPTVRSLLDIRISQARRGKADPQDVGYAVRFPASTCMSAPAPISTISMPS